MGFYSVVAACFILFASISQMNASVLPAVNSGLSGKTEKFTLRITEQEANFEEQVAIDEDNDIEYFTVPAHNDVNAADFLFDFKMNITLARLKEHGVCYLTPLPSELPKPHLLKQGLRKMTALPPNHQITTVSHKWKIDAKIDKTTLRREVRDFCGQYPIYRLYDYTPDSIVVETERLRERAKRQAVIGEFEMCGQFPPSRSECSADQWILRCKFTESHCVYYLVCRPNVQRKLHNCETKANHLSGRLMCCEARCPS